MNSLESASRFRKTFYALKIISVFILFALTLVSLYEIFYIKNKPALYYLEKAAMKKNKFEKTFCVYYYFNALEFTDGANSETDSVSTIFGDVSGSFDCNYVLITKEGLFVNKNTSYFKTHITNLCIIISEDLSLKELNRGYQFIKKYFQFKRLLVTSKKYIEDEFELHMQIPLKLEMKKYSNQDFQNILVNLQNPKN